MFTERFAKGTSIPCSVFTLQYVNSVAHRIPQIKHSCCFAGLCEACIIFGVGIVLMGMFFLCASECVHAPAFMSTCVHICIYSQMRHAQNYEIQSLTIHECTHTPTYKHTNAYTHRRRDSVGELVSKKGPRRFLSDRCKGI